MSTVILRHGRMVLCCMWAILLCAAPSAEARWLDRVRGSSAGAHVVHQASIFQSLTRNVAELTDLFGDMLDAVKEGDGAKVEDVWRDIEKLPGDIVREAFPVIRVVDATASLAAGVKNRLDTAKRHIERFAEDVDGFGPRSALAISEDERHYYASTTGILGDEPLPSVKYSAAIQASSEQPSADIWKDGHGVERRNDKHPGHTSIVDSLEAHDSYESSLESLEKLWVVSKGDTNVARADVETGDYEDALKALDRRRSELANERHRQLSEDYSSDQRESSDSSSEVAANGPVAPTVTSGGDDGTQSARADGSTVLATSDRDRGEFGFTCKNEVVGSCYEHNFQSESEMQIAREEEERHPDYECVSNRNSCATNETAHVCRYRWGTGTQVITQYDFWYDFLGPSADPVKDCAEKDGTYLGKR